MDQQKQPRNMESQLRHLEDGRQKELCIPCEPMEIIEDLLSPAYLESSPKQRKRKSSTVESGKQNKRMTLKGKQKQCRENIPTMKSSRISDQASTSKGKDSFGWWTKSCEEMSKKLSYPIEIDSVGLPSTSSNGYVREVQPNSWSKTKRYIPRNRSFPRISWPSSMYSPYFPADTMECGDTPKENQKKKGRSKRNPNTLLKAVKTRMYPTAMQAKVLRKWMKAMRYTYNQGLSLVRQGKAPLNLDLKKIVVSSKLYGYKEAKDGKEAKQSREEFNSKLENINQCRKYIDRDSKIWKEVEKTPPNIRTGAILDLMDSFKTARASLVARIQKVQRQKRRWKKRVKVSKKKENEKRRRRWKKTKAFEIKFKSKNLTKDSMRFEPKNIKICEGGIMLFNDSTLGTVRTSEKIENVASCPRISYVFGRWYFIFAQEIVMKSIEPTKRIIALDPGVRSFQSYFTSDNEQGDIGSDTSSLSDKFYSKIKRIRAKINLIKNHQWIPRCRQKRLKSLRRAWYRANARARHLMDDFHWKTIRFMLTNFDTVVCPKLAVSQLVSKEENKDLRAITRRRMLFQRHSEFNTRLRFKASTYIGKTILDLEEHGTSMTCSSCGSKNLFLGSSKIFTCPSCELKCDRDLNSAKNHILKAAFGTTDY